MPDARASLYRLEAACSAADIALAELRQAGVTTASLQGLIDLLRDEIELVRPEIVEEVRATA